MRLQQIDSGIQYNKLVAVAAAVDLSERSLHLPFAPDAQIDDRPGWYWRSAEGKQFIKAQAGSACLDDPEIGWQREED